MRALSKRCKALSAAAVIISQSALAQSNDVEPRQSVSSTQLSIPHSSLSANIDGDLNDAIWQDALTISLDIVNSPWNNQPSPVKTFAKVVENGEYLYIAFDARDPNPKEIFATLADRDSVWSDDLVGIKLDTANNRRLNYSFLVNPYGVQIDEIFNEMTGESNDAWDGIWHSFGKITDNGYQVEMAIPYQILNFEQSDQQKSWAFELLRTYPRDATLRISHVPLDKNNTCWLCQYPELVGFEKAKASKSLTLTPALVAGKSQQRDISPKSDWQNETKVEPSLDLRWSINSNNVLNATLNPDFSTVETDGGQFQVNQLDSLFYEEKRAFFLENAEYFKSNFNLLHTRNIRSPDYGAKLTGASGKHTYGAFIANDTETSYIKSGNRGSRLQTLDEKNHATALRYRYDINDDFSIGAINTLRLSDSRDNVVMGLDTKYRFDDSNSILAQVVHSDTKTKHDKSRNLTVNAGGTPETIDDSDIAYKVSLVHESEDWRLKAHHQEIGQHFRADLGFMPKADYQQQLVEVKRLFYGEQESFWSDANIGANWNQDKGETDNLLLERGYKVFAGFHGPLLSYSEVSYTNKEKIGSDDHNANTPDYYFDESLVSLYNFVQLTNKFSTEFEVTAGDKIDYSANRLADYKEIWTEFSWDISTHLGAEIYYAYSDLAEDEQQANGYVEQIADITLTYQFDVQSYLRLTLNYYDLHSEPNTPNADRYKDLGTQLIYSYKLNPQTVFYLGYSDKAAQYGELNRLTQQERSIFTKISYAWMP